jgi:hypothetical protein
MSNDGKNIVKPSFINKNTTRTQVLTSFMKSFDKFFW